MCLRYVDLSSLPDPHINECLVSFIHLERANTLSITKKILEAISASLVSLNLSKIRGQAYDGASVMSSDIAGVQAKIKEISPLASYTHCYSHCLNLSIAASCKIQEVGNLISLINVSHLFLSNSPKRQQLFKLIVSEFLPLSKASKLPGLCTQWIERHTCFEVFLEIYEPLVTFLDAILSPSEYPNLVSSDGSWKWDRETKEVKAQELKAALSSFHTLAVFIITKNVLDEGKSLAAIL